MVDKIAHDGNCCVFLRKSHPYFRVVASAEGRVDILHCTQPKQMIEGTCAQEQQLNAAGFPNPTQLSCASAIF